MDRVVEDEADGVKATVGSDDIVGAEEDGAVNPEDAKFGKASEGCSSRTELAGWDSRR